MNRLLIMNLMRHWAGWIVLLMIGNGCGAAVRQTNVFVSGQGGYHTYRIPSLISTSKGTLLAFCEGRKDNQRDHGDIDIIVKCSADGGRSWSPLSIVYEEGGDAKITIGNPCPVVDQSTGRIWLTYCRDNKRVFTGYSDDDGITWSKPRDITADVKKDNWDWYATGPGVGLQITAGPCAGRLIIPCDHRLKGDKKTYRSHVFYSDDHGKNWLLGGVIPDDRVNECQVVELAEGRLMMNMRNYDDSKHHRAVSLSGDGGMTWSTIFHDSELIEPRCQASLIRYGVNGPAQDYLLFSNPAHVKKRVNMTVRLSKDQGDTWPLVLPLHPGPAAYSSLAVLADGSIGCLYECGGKKPYEKISLACFPLDDINQFAGITEKLTQEAD